MAESDTHRTAEEAAQAHAQASIDQTVRFFGQRVQEVAAYGRYWLELHWDKLKIHVVWYAVLGLTAVAALLTLALVVASAAVLLVLGSAQLLGEHLYGGSIALGYVTVGGVILVLVPMVLFVGGSIAKRTIAAGLVKKYAAKKELQRAKYGHDVEERAAAGVATA